MQKSKKQKLIGVLLLLLVFLFWGILFYAIGKPMIQFVSEPDAFRAWVEDHGFFGRIMFVGMVVLQMIVSVIPGEPLEIGAGYAFGALEGTLLCTVGNFLGAAAVFALVRTFGVRLLELFYSREKILSLKFLQNTKRVDLIVFLIYFLPGTPKDLISYFVGLTKMKWSTWLLIATIGRLPSVITSTMGGNALGTREYRFAIIIFSITVVISLIGWLIYHLYTKNSNKKGDRNAENGRT